MAKIILVAATLVTFLMESLCNEQPGMNNKQQAGGNDITYRDNYSDIKSQSGRRSLPFVNNTPNNQTKVYLNKVSFSDGGMRKNRNQLAYISSFRKKPENHENLNLPKQKDSLGKVIKKASTNPEAKPVTSDVTASRRTPAAAGAVLSELAGDANVQEAVVEKGIEVAGKLVDKYLQNIDEAQEKASEFLKKEIKLDIMPDKGWQTEDMFIPAGYHINAEIEGTEPSTSADDPVQPYNYPAGMGGIMMNGCWGSDYKEGDPCYDAMEKTDQCRNMIDGAAFIGVGFDGRGEYSPESRKMSIIQRSCGGHSSYDDFQVPDTMNVHGIYDTSAHMSVFTSRSEYQKYLQGEAGVSGSYFGFYGGVKSAWGSSESGAKQSNLAIFDIDVDRYEIFQDEVKPQDLSRSFLREFLSLPDSYFEPGAPAKFQDFILRWGTHYIKSARFGGQLELRKTQLASTTSSKEEFAEESEVEFKSLFWSAGSKSSTKSGESSKSQRNYMSTSVVVQGGSQRIAAIISDMYSPTFKTEFTEWLESIPAYPKAFKFLMGSITDLLDFRANDLFPDETIQYDCEVHKQELTEDTKTKKKYYMKDGKRVYCDFESKEELESKLKLKRMSLKRAIEVYMEEGAMSISDISLPAGESGCDGKEFTATVQTFPKWSEITTGDEPATFRVTFDLLRDLTGAGGLNIPKSMSRHVRYREKMWVVANEQGQFHWYGGFSNGESANLERKKMSILGLVLKYEENDGSLVLQETDYEESKKYFPSLSPLLVKKKVAHAQWTEKKLDSTNVNKEKRTEVGMPTSLLPSPCNVQWSNGLRFDPGDTDGKCLHFTASTKGALYVVFSAVPSDKETWYTVEISPYRIGIYKLYKRNAHQVSTVRKNAVALGDSVLFQSYFVCITETMTSRGTLIEYGKSMGTISSADVYLSMSDYHDPLHVRFYSFGNGREPAQVVDSHVKSRMSTKTNCRGDTEVDNGKCVQRCHATCDPIAGCRSSSQGEPKATECNECRYAVSSDNSHCLEKCNPGEKPDKNKHCQKSYDLKFKKSTDESSSVPSIVGFPVLPEFSICIWINVENVQPQSIEDEWKKIFSYVNSPTGLRSILSVESQVIENEGGEGQTVRIVLFLKAEQGSPEGITVLFTRDNEWHHYCVTRNSISGETSLFIDGSKQLTHTFFPNLAPLSEGRMIVGKFENANFEGKISGLNVWDRILKTDEVETMSKSTCDDSAQSIKDWYDMKSKFQKVASSFEILEPSECKVKKTDEEIEETPEPENKKSVKKNVFRKMFPKM